MGIDKKDILDATVSLVSSYMNCINTSALHIHEDNATDFANFIEIVYKKVAEITQ